MRQFVLLPTLVIARRPALRSAAGVILAGAVPVLSALPAAARAQQRTSAPTSLVFDGVTVVDVEQGTLRPAQRVVITGTRIATVGRARAVPVPRGAQVIKAWGKYLIPGLWDMHFHSYGRPPQPFYSVLIANGVTGIRDPGQQIPLDTVLQWRAAIAAGTHIGPRQLVTGSMLDDTTLFGGIGKDREPVTGFAPFAGSRRIVLGVRTPAEARRVVDSLAQAGAEFIKTHFDGLSRETFFAMAAETRRLGLRLEGHLPDRVTLTEGSDSGMRIIDHLGLLLGALGSDQLGGLCQGESASLDKCTALARRLRRNGTWIVIGPTGRSNAVVRSNLPYLPDSVRYAIGRSDTAARRLLCPALKLMVRSGMPLLSGTDVYLARGLPTSLVHEELAIAVRCGLSPLQALQTVTLNPARYLHGTDSLGTVAPGKLADLVLLDANPLADISNTTAIRAVVANGRYFDRGDLDRLLLEVERQARGGKQP